MGRGSDRSYPACCIGQDQDERHACGISNALKRGRARRGKLHREAAGAEVVPKLLAKQHLDIGLIINHENEEFHGRSPDLAMVAAPRGRTILKFGELAGPRIDLYRPAMLLDDDVVTDGQA